MNKVARELLKIAKVIIGMTLDEAVDNAKNYSREIVEGVIDSVGEESPDDYEAAEVVADDLGGSWQVYRDGSDITVVRNIKGEGFPDCDDVFEKAAKQADVPEENIRAYCDDRMVNDWFWDDVRFETEYIDDATKGKFRVVGRSGGYWGLEYEWDMVGLNERYVEGYVKKLINDKNLVRKILSRELRSDEDIEEGDVVDALVYDFSDRVFNEDADKIYEVDKKWKSEFAKLDKMITGTIKDFESSDRWVEMIIANQYWEEP
jgi:hypothetical protein